MEIRRYQPRDADAVRRLNEEVLRAAGTDPADIPHPDDIEDVQGAYIDTGGEFLVADRGGDIVGMGGLRVDGTEGELFRMRVAIGCQREGVGTALLGALEDAARERSVDRLSAWTAQRQSAAVAFYPKHGYEQIETATRDPDYTLFHFRKAL
jgi:ribosomal protein S18 acetylase RimI-like enzyme